MILGVRRIFSSDGFSQHTDKQKMATKVFWSLCAVLFYLLDLCEAAIQCGQYVCYNSGAYCCGQSCCYSVWTYWWFWMLWVLLLIIMISCGYGARRRYIASRPRYIVIQHPEGMYGTQAAYGSVAYPVGGAYGQAAAPPVNPTKPPAYSVDQDKPPAYNAAVNQAYSSAPVAQP